MSAMGEVHTIWIPMGWSVEQAWETIRRDERVVIDQDQGVWVNVDEEGRLIVEEDAGTP